MSRGLAHTGAESTLPPPIRRSADLKTPAMVQRLSNHASEPLSKYALTPQQRRDQVAKLYRAKLWLACAGIYRRGRQWDGAQAAIQDALLSDSCPEDVFTEVPLRLSSPPPPYAKSDCDCSSDTYIWTVGRTRKQL